MKRLLIAVGCGSMLAVALMAQYQCRQWESCQSLQDNGCFSCHTAGQFSIQKPGDSGMCWPCDGSDPIIIEQASVRVQHSPAVQRVIDRHSLCTAGALVHSK